MAERILLIDASSLIYPAFHVMGELKTSAGLPTGAIYGYARTVLMLLREYPSQYIAVAFDSRGPTHRHEKFSEYKAHRPAMDEALATQIPKIKELTEALRLKRFEQPGYEADDIIAALVAKAQAQGLEILIVSGDKDLLQLVGDGVRVLKPGRDITRDLKILDAEGVREYLGVPPGQVRDFLALVGDSSDNVPGVPGIGEKTAQKLLSEFGSLDALLENLEKIEPKKLGERLKNFKDQALLSRELVQLRPPPLEVSLEECRAQLPDRERLRALLEELEFRSLLKELDLLPAAPPAAARLQDLAIELVLDEYQLEAMLARLEDAAEISLDTETTSEDAMTAELIGISLAIEPGSGFYIPLGHSYLGAPPQLPRDLVVKRLKALLETKPIIGQNLKYDAKILRRSGINIKNIAFDSMLAAYLLDPEGRKDLNELARRYLGHSVMDFSELGAERMDMVPVEQAARYSVADAETVIRLKEKMLPELRSRNQEKLFYEIELPLIPVLIEMEINGILLDREVLREQAKELETLATQLLQDIFHLAGQDFNPNSPKQVAYVLFEKLKLPVLRKTKTGPSTDAYVLQELAGLHPLPEKLLAYRELEKLLSTYVKKLPEYINPRTGRVHTTFQQHVTVTGRLSSMEPNLQNIPVRSELGGQIRKAFVAPPGRVLIGADYSQIELRVLAHLSGDAGLIEAFERDEDVHARTAATIFNIPIESVGPRERRIAKMINFGLSYGMTGYGLAQRTGLSRSEADRFIKNYFEKYPGVKAYMERVVREAEEKRYLETLLGRRRYFVELSSQTKREAINFPVQGSASDIMKLAMLRVYEKIKSDEIKAAMLLQIHDELIFEADVAHAERAAQIIKQTMEGVFTLRVPLKVETHIGTNWGEI
ncbi:MAG: DNA polymerase I [Candidatus Bipolaricaulota bacterium]|nr:DNA polymerase I [Candidatus Bipolaricaulota bacterium]MDW8031673.1 DNA polymerase I [Candidatus Bipolaricaulota bacterium]